MNDNEQLTRIEKMLAALLKSSNHIWWIGGYVYGRTSNDDPFVILYPAGEQLDHKVCRVYPHDFKKLPAFVDTANVPADTDANPGRAQAQKKGIYHECPLFQIVTYDGRETEMKRPEQRFGDVLRIGRQPAPAAPPPPPPADDDGDDSEAPILPDYRPIALEATTAAAFNFGAYMVLKNGLYTDQERVTAIRGLIADAWKPGPATNAAMLEALTTYRDKRGAAEKRGDTATQAHNFALIEVRNRYNRLTKK